MAAAAPIGICGSGMIDAVAEMFLTRRNRPAREDKPGRKKRQGAGYGEDGPEFVLIRAGESGSGKDISLTEPDIDNIVRTKGAIYAGFSTLLKKSATPSRTWRRYISRAGLEIIWMSSAP